MTPRLPTALFAALATLNLLSVGLDLTLAEWLTKPLLMPTLIWLLLARGATEPRTRPWLLTGLALATIADITLLIPGETALLTGIGFFAAMQLCFITAYTRVARTRTGWRTHPWLPALYLAIWLGFVLGLWTTFGPLAGPIAGYGLLLATMAATAGTVSPRVGLGGGLFMISDLMIGLGIADIDFPARDMAIMATYSAAQYLIVTGMTRRAPADRPRAESERGARSR